MELTVAGQPVHAATGGRPFDAKKPAVVFLHGAGMDHTVWVLQTRWFAYHGWSVLAVDLPGHGGSGGMALASIATIADWVPALLDAAGLAKATLIGHSMGALAALDCAARHVDRVAAVALLGIAPKMPVHPDLLSAAERNDPVAFQLICDWGHGPSGHRGGHRAPGLWMLGGAERLLAKSRPGALSVDLLACNAYAEAEARAPAVRCPTLFVLGALDRMTPAKAGQGLAAKVANAKTVTLAGAGHMMMIEKPDDTLDALKANLSAKETT
jgi:pimeloyl-ACP methyl ester carboxylesterase